MLVFFGSLLRLALTVRALVVSIRERYLLGIIAALVRIVLLVVVFAFTPAFLPGMIARPTVVTGVAAFALLAAAFGGPAASIGALVHAWRRTSHIPAADEERANRPVRAFLPLAILDAIGVVIELAALVIAD